MNKYILGETYKATAIDMGTEIIPQSSCYKGVEGEYMVTEPHPETASLANALKANENNIFFPLDKTVTALIGTFGNGCVTTKVLKELLTMMGESFSPGVFDSCIKRLHRYGLINISRFMSEGKTPSTIRILTLASNGSALAGGWEVPHQYNACINKTAAYKVKSQAQTAQIISNFLKTGAVDRFCVRPKLANTSAGSGVRPSASITMGGLNVYVETPRRHEGWEQELCDKLERYELTFGGVEKVTVIFGGEDEEMNSTIAKLIAQRQYAINALFTYDMAMFGEKFMYCLYSENGNGEKQHYKFNPNKRQSA